MFGILDEYFVWKKVSIRRIYWDFLGIKKNFFIRVNYWVFLCKKIGVEVGILKGSIGNFEYEVRR